MRVAVLVSACIALAAAGPATAQSRQELDERITILEQRLAVQPQAAATRNLERIDALEQQIRTLTGQVEELQFRNRQLENTIDTLREDMLSTMAGPPPFAGADAGFGAGADFDRAPGGPADLGPRGGSDVAIVNPNDPFASQRRAATGVLGAPGGPVGGGALNRGVPADSGPMTVPAPERVDLAYRPTGADPDLLYSRGLTQLGVGEFGAALDYFAEFKDVAPNDPRIGEAWYWIGSIYRTEELPEEAAAALLSSLEIAPDGPLAPEAMVHLGAALVEMGQTAQGCQTLANVASRYAPLDPATERLAAREARTAGCR